MPTLPLPVLAGTPPPRGDDAGDAKDYYGKLKPTCVVAAESFEDKTARRKQEIDSLKEALDILSGDDIAV